MLFATVRLAFHALRAVAMHSGSIGASAVGNHRRKVREGQIDIRPEVDHL